MLKCKRSSEETVKEIAKLMAGISKVENVNLELKEKLLQDISRSQPILYKALVVILIIGLL